MLDKPTLLQTARRIAGRSIILGCLVMITQAWTSPDAIAEPVKPTTTADPVANSTVDFRRDIQPILSRHCYACHGPDGHAREADLRLDVESEAKDFAIVPGDSQSSEVMVRILSDDPDSIMPPPETPHALTESEKELISRWIDEGAGWQNHWAFEPIVAPEIPGVDEATDEAAKEVTEGWTDNAIDRFLLRRMRERGLSPSKQSSKHQLLRRVHFDLIGLPPTPDQANAFARDSSENAFEKVVDRLLESPHYGERMAATWLDAARYADTNGYQNDFNRSMWLWRDWVVDSFNSNMPFDQFVVEQLAGDLLPEPSDAQLLATGFNRNNRTVTEGGAIQQEWQVENCIDRVEASAGAFLGLTIGCARCHDHKYDPVSQKEFFEFYAFFNNVDEKSIYFESRGNQGPQLKVATAEFETKKAELELELEKLQQQFDAQLRESAVATLRKWRGEGERGDRDQSNAGDAARGQPVYRYPSITSEPTAGTLTTGTSPIGLSVQLSGLTDAAGQVPPPHFTFDRTKPFSWTVWVRGDSRGAIFAKMDVGNGYRGVDGLILGDGTLKIHLIHQWNQNALAVITETALAPNIWNFVAVTYDGTSKASGVNVYLNGSPVKLRTDVDQLNASIETDVPFKIGQRSDGDFFTGELSDFRLGENQLSAEEVHQRFQITILNRYRELTSESGSGETSEASLEALLSLVSSLHPNRLQSEMDVLKKKHTDLLKNQPTVMVMKDRAEYRPTYLLKRGAYDQPDTSEELWPSIPDVLPPLTEDQPPNRLGLARWMIDARNPLVPRVAVNQAWQQFFGRGFVTTADNFGVQGSPPSHPELLDWLADDFRHHGWNLKRLHKQIVMSATYQQSSVPTPSAARIDPENQWLSRAPRQRLSAEQLRDQALAVSGLLSRKTGGPSVYPYQPDGLWEELAGGANGGPYRLSSGEDLYRRSLYTFRKRTVPHPTLTTFDAPSGEICQLQRTQTNTPLQALALLNDTTYVEAARALAERMWETNRPANSDADEPGTDAAISDAEIQQAIRRGFEMACLRQPTGTELTTLHNGFQHYLNHYQSHPEDAEELIRIGESEPTGNLEKAHLAAMTSVAAIVLNLDEVVTKE